MTTTHVDAGPIVDWARANDKTPQHAITYIDFIRYDFFQFAREQDAIRAELLAALEAAHGALDTLLAMLILRDASFKPTHSPVWPAVVQAGAAIAKAKR